jgi:hypothetical protein
MKMCSDCEADGCGEPKCRCTCHNSKPVSAPTGEVKRGTAEYYANEQRVIDLAHEIISRVVPNVIRLAYIRHDLAEHLEDMTEDEFAQDALQLALGEESGCIDPDDLDAENCEVMFVEEKLRVLHSDHIAKCQELDKAKEERDNLNTCLVACTKERNDAYFRLIETYKVPDAPSHSVVELSQMVEQVCTRAEKAESDLVAARKALKQALSCLVQWRCWSCRHEEYTVPKDAFGPCPKCGQSGTGHMIFSDDREELLKALSEVKP